VSPVELFKSTHATYAGVDSVGFPGLRQAGFNLEPLFDVFNWRAPAAILSRQDVSA